MDSIYTHLLAEPIYVGNYLASIFIHTEELQRRGYYDDVKGLIETMYRENGNRRVTIAAHSNCC